MTVFYWTMGALIAGTFLPSVLFLALYVFIDEDALLQRARKLWAFTRVLSLFGVNLLIWGHVVLSLWRIGFG